MMRACTHRDVRHLKAMAPIKAQIEAGMEELRAYLSDEAEDFDPETAATCRAWSAAIAVRFKKIASQMTALETSAAE